jgi:hypothetical protein
LPARVFFNWKLKTSQKMPQRANSRMTPGEAVRSFPRCPNKSASLPKSAIFKNIRKIKLMKNIFNHLNEPEGNPFGPERPGAIAESQASGGGSEQSERRAQWSLVLNGAVLFTAMAVNHRDWAKARQGESLIATASGRAGVDSALLTAIFGGEVPQVDMSNPMIAACHDAGKSASAEQLAIAREVVRANKNQRDAVSAAAANANAQARAEERSKERQDARSRRAESAVTAGLLVGATVDVVWSYKQAKRDVAQLADGTLVECYGRLPGAGAGSARAIVKKVRGRLPVVELTS